jgi:geranylgeranyl pyrophosphate synthase
MAEEGAIGEVMTAPDRRRLEEAFRTSLPLPSGTEPHLRGALLRVLTNPGSLVRPAVVLAMSREYGVEEDRGIKLATALEYFHTASLLLDDLPSMDNASRRRGLRCIHLDFGEAAAILSALALVNRAYALSWQAVASAAGGRSASGLRYLERHLGLDGLLQGQSLDLHYRPRAGNVEAMAKIAAGKTVSLIRLTLVLPALLGGAPAVEVRALERLAGCWGLAYQVVDDLKDLLGSAEQDGKTVARDELLGRPNAALVLGVDGALLRLGRLTAIADRLLRSLTSARPGLLFLCGLRDRLARENRRLADAAAMACAESCR